MANRSTAISVEVHFNGKPTIIDTRLASLQIGSLNLTPAFDPDVLAYSSSDHGFVVDGLAGKKTVAALIGK